VVVKHLRRDRHVLHVLPPALTPDRRVAAALARGARYGVAPMPLEIRQVRGLRELREFVALPYRLHTGTPWIPPLKLERYLFLLQPFNAYFKHGDAAYYLARRDGRVVGRISAQVDHAYNEFHSNRWGMFGFLEFEEDQEVLDALLTAAENWLRRRGCDRMVGPMDFVLNEESGVVIEGFGLEPLIRQPWHPPYYQQKCEAAGLTKAMDLFSWGLDVGNRGTLLPIIPEIAEQAHTKHGITIRKMTRRSLRRDLDEFAKVYNAAWSRNWGFVPLSKEDLDEMALNYQLVFDGDWFMIAEDATGTVAAAITIPDINQVLKKMNGRLLPLGWWYYLNKHKIIDRLRVGFLGVLPEYQHTGVGAQLYMEHFEVAARTHRKYGEAGWILESNRAMNRGLEAMGGKIVKRYRVYERLLSSGAA
ncbi:MAG TPA: GNAT family N-acetyltransferase, partial [Solirubrobacteraceae bacterium]|nr:GNAT family N-acetyltransferase [Solirubrobacteraceae bacterium]